MNEEKYLNDFNIISVAGMSKSKSILAIKEAKQGNYDKAHEHLHEANKMLNEAHKLQFQMLQQESRGKTIELTIITVHAQDHITMALLFYEIALEIIEIYKRIQQK